MRSISATITIMVNSQLHPEIAYARSCLSGLHLHLCVQTEVLSFNLRNLR